MTVTTGLIATNANGDLFTNDTEQPLILESLFSQNPNVDKFRLILNDDDGTELYRQTISKTQQFTLLPKLIVKPGYQLIVVPTTGAIRFTANFKPVAILESIAPDDPRQQPE